MSKLSKILGVALFGMLIGLSATPAMAAQRVVRVPRAAIGPRVVARAPILAPRVVVRSYAPYGWYGNFGPGWYSPAYTYFPVYGMRPDSGDVKIDTHLKDASVYVDGGYVGPVSKFKKFSLKSGNHDIELRDGSGRQIFSQRVQVIVGKAIEIRPPS